MSPPLMVSLLAALWLSLGRCGATGSLWPRPGCDNGKLLIDRDLPHPLQWTCPVSSWTESIQSLPSIDTVYDPVPASPVCMDTPITYNQTIPNSGAYRPVRAEGGEYLYCPPQRWLNNLHHGATVFLYLPCAPLRERLHLSILARSCLSDYIITPHPDLHKHRPLAVVSWGRTLELSSVATSDVCDWLETTMTGSDRGDVGQTRKYNLLLTWPAEREHRRTNQEERSHMSVRRCCERTLSSLLDGGTEAAIDRRRGSVNEKRGKGSRRRRRAAIRGKVEEGGDERERGNRTADNVTSLSTNQAAGTILDGTEPIRVQKHDNTSDPGTSSSSEPVLRSDLPEPRRTGPPAPGSELRNQNLNTQKPVPPVASNALEPTPRADPRSFGTMASQPKASPEPQKQELTGRPEPRQLQRMNPKHSNPTPRTDTLVNGASRKRILTPRPGTPSSELGQVTQALGKEENTKEERKEGENQQEKDSDKHREKDSDEQNRTAEKTADRDKQREEDSGKQQDTAGETVKDNALVDVKEREVESKRAHSNTRAHSGSRKVGSWSGSVSQHQPKSHAHPQPQDHPQPHHRHPQPVTQQSEKPDCGACDADGHCECTEYPGPQEGASVLRKGVPRTPRTDEAVWAAAALGFLLVLLALSVLHTRLYRHWKTTPSLYWHDPRKDYDSVADVIRRRLRIAERRRKRRTSLSRRQECALLPNSSSDEEDQ